MEFCQCSSIRFQFERLQLGGDRRSMINLTQDKCADSLQGTHVGQYFDVEIRAGKLLFVNDPRNIIHNMRASREEVWKYLDFIGAGVNQVGNGGVDLGTGYFKKGTLYHVKRRAGIFLDAFGESSDFLVGFLAAASVCNN